MFSGVFLINQVDELFFGDADPVRLAGDGVAEHDPGLRAGLGLRAGRNGHGHGEGEHDRVQSDGIGAAQGGAPQDSGRCRAAFCNAGAGPVRLGLAPGAMRCWAR